MKTGSVEILENVINSQVSFLKTVILSQAVLGTIFGVIFAMNDTKQELKIKKLEEKLGVIMFALDIKEMPDGTMTRNIKE